MNVLENVTKQINYCVGIYEYGVLCFLQAKHLQFVSGVDAVSFWLATYSWDLINYLFPMLGIMIVFAAFQVDSLKDNLGVIFLLLVNITAASPFMFSIL